MKGLPMLRELAMIMMRGEARKLLEAIRMRWSLKLPRNIALKTDPSTFYR